MLRKFTFKPLLTGALAAMPLAITGAVLLWLFNFLHKLFGPESAFGRLLESIGLQFVASEFTAYFLGLGGTVAALYGLGLLVEIGLKNSLSTWIDLAINRIPLVRTIYQTSKQMVGMLDKSDRTDLKSMSPVICQLGGKGGTTLLGLQSCPDPVKINGSDYFAILIPSAPVPFGGFIIYLPVAWVKPADFGFDGLLNVYMTMGATSPIYMNDKKA
jgi:uncharacterized membrane protein